MTSITLYATVGCHLCELANKLLDEILKRQQVTIHQVEIGDDDALIAQYGITIPVLKFDDGSELNWPFLQQDIEIKIDQLQSN